MSRKKLPPAGPSIPRERARVQVTRPQSNWYNVYQAAERRDFNGYFYIPTLDLGQALNRWTRDALRERITWLYLNVSPVRMVINGLAAEEARTGLWPKWTTANPHFNKFATDSFHWTNHDPRFFSADGRDSFYSAQVAIRKLIRLHGDCFGQFLRPAPGSTKPLLSLIPGWRVDNFGDEKPESGWVDGVLPDRLGRAQFFRVLGKGSDGKRTRLDVPADDMLQMHDGLLGGQLRGEPALASAAMKMFRREDIAAALANGTLARERMGWALEQVGQGSNIPMALPDGGEVTTETATDGSTITVQKIYGTNAREDVSIPDVPLGKTLKMLESSRPGTEVRQFQDETLREVCWSTGYPPDYVFFLAGLTQGTAVRIVIQRVQTMLDVGREQLKHFVHRWAIFDTWQRIKTGVFDGVENGIPADWWMHKVMDFAPLTTDRGREGRLFSDRVANGQMSISRFHALEEEDAGDVEDEIFERIGLRLDKLAALNTAKKTELKYSDIFRTADSKQIIGAQPAPAGAPPDPNAS